MLSCIFCIKLIVAIICVIVLFSRKIAGRVKQIFKRTRICKHCDNLKLRYKTGFCRCPGWTVGRLESATQCAYYDPKWYIRFTARCELWWMRFREKRCCDCKSEKECAEKDMGPDFICYECKGWKFWRPN